MNNNTFQEVTLLITHYNRSASLERLLYSIKEINCSFKEIVVSDDGSKPEHLEHINNLLKKINFRLITSPINKGLGNNLNKGLQAINTPYILYIQEDFIPTEKFPQTFNSAIEIMESNNEIDLIRFYSSTRYPYLKIFNNDFSELFYSFWKVNYNKIYVYGDQPNLRRKTFENKFGKYKEGIHGDRTEYAMCISFVQKKGKALIYNDFKKIFIHNNSIFEPSTMTRQSIKNSNIFPMRLIRTTYRFIKYNLDILFMKV